MSMRWLSMSLVSRVVISPTRGPVLGEVGAASSRATSVPLKICGTTRGAFALGVQMKADDVKLFYFQQWLSPRRKHRAGSATMQAQTS
jgi:hypothetical protein